jgi:TPR repeat protein
MDRDTIGNYFPLEISFSADQGHASAQYNLGVFYERGRGGLPRDEREAKRPYKLAAAQGPAMAQAALTKKLGMFSRLFGRGADTGDDWRQQQEGQERQREAAERERERQQQEEQARQMEAAERDRQMRQEEQGRWRAVASGKMSAAQALEILGINAGATE